MALISMRQLLDHAAEHGYGVPAFNVNNLEQTRAIMEAADQTNSPVIMQASAGARKYAGASFLRHLMAAAIEEFPHIPVVVHQDLAFEHGPVEGLASDEIKRYVRYIADRRLSQLGLQPIYRIDGNPLPWLEAMMNGAEHANFFENRATEYSRAATQGAWEEAFD